MLEIPSSRQFPKGELMEPRVSMEDILAVQSLAMGYLSRRARTSRNHNRHHGFAMYDREGLDDDQLYDGSEDSYMSCLVKKVGYDQWRMRVSFLTMTMSEETKHDARREDYAFDWLKNGNRMAWTWTKYRISDPAGNRIETICDVRPTEAVECESLKLRMLEFSEKSGPLASLGNRPASGGDK